MTERDELRDHSFDGIQEYDNDLPRWWVWLFWVTIIFSIVYLFVYDFGPLQFASETIDADLAALRQMRQSEAAGSGAVDEAILQKVAADPSRVAEGKTIFANRCAVCHGDQGQGLIGPNLTDAAFLHGSSMIDTFHVVSEGVLEKGMLAWKDQLTPEELVSVVGYVWSLRGTNPPNPKAPEGEVTGK